MCTERNELETLRLEAHAYRAEVRLRWQGVDSMTADVARGNASFTAVAASSVLLHHLQTCAECIRARAYARIARGQSPRG